MKKVKIMLTAITVFAVVGGALAFKAKDASFGFTIYTSTQASGCTVQVDNFELGGNANATFATNAYDGDCASRFTRARN